MNKEYKSTIEAFIDAKREIKSINNDTQAFDFKYANLVAVQNEVNRVLESKGLDLIEMKHSELSHFNRVYTTATGKDKIKYVSLGKSTFTIGSIWDDKRLEWEIPANFSNDKSEHDAVYSANSIAYRYFLLRAFAIPTLDEDKARNEDIKDNIGKNIIKEPLRDEKGNIIWEPSLKQMQFFNALISKNETLKHQFQIDVKQLGLNSAKEYIIYKGAEWFKKWLGDNK